VPFGHGRPGIFWLRLYEGPAGHVGIVTEVPGNPARSVTNGISQIAYHIGKHFAIAPHRLVLYEVWPSGSPTGDSPDIHRVNLRGQTGWDKASRKEIEAHVGGALSRLPPHDDLYRRVLACGGGVTRKVLRSIFEAVPVLTLPPPHNPSRCRHSDRFGRTCHRQSASLAQRSEVVQDLESGAAFLASLSPRDLDACPFHDAHWKEIAEESARIVQALGRGDTEIYVEAAHQAPLPSRDRKWLVSLFTDPIVIDGGFYTNGQHRGCALRFSGASRAAVVTGEEMLGEERVDWKYQGDG
jgi:hypothetical protein